MLSTLRVSSVIRGPVSLVACGLFLSCAPESDARLVGIGVQAQFFAHSAWTAPVNLGAPVNSSAGDQNATLSTDELSLYFQSNREGGLGSNDLWVSQRACRDCPWETPANLGAAVNGPGSETAPRISGDGHLLFFVSDRPGGQGSTDIYLSRRDNPTDDFGWADAINLGTDVNTALGEAGPDYLQAAEDGAGNLYFVRAGIYHAVVSRYGATRGPAVLVSELGDASSTPGHPSVRADGREIFFQATRAGGLGGVDLWTSTRNNVNEPWSSPVNLGAPLNTAFTDFQPTVSHDGRTLLFASNRPGGRGGNDLWISARTQSGR